MTTMTTKSDGATIRRLREARGLTGVQLAQLAGIDKRVLSKIEREKRTGLPGTRLKIANALGVHLSAITYSVPDAPRTRKAS